SRTCGGNCRCGCACRSSTSWPPSTSSAASSSVTREPTRGSRATLSTTNCRAVASPAAMDRQPVYFVLRVQAKMQRSVDRILTTHTGSLPRPPDLRGLLKARETGEPFDENAFGTRVRSAVAECVAQQVACGIDVVGDGELGKTNFVMYV